MKGYRTPSWFRAKARVKEKQIVARTSKPEIEKSKTARRDFVKRQSNKARSGG